jgi:hypothetical protein
MLPSHALDRAWLLQVNNERNSLMTSNDACDWLYGLGPIGINNRCREVEII